MNRRLLAVGLVAALGIGGLVAYVALSGGGVPQLFPPVERCEASADGRHVELDLEQSGNAALIAAISVRRGMPARAATIALAAAYQESDLRNLDYGDRDSVGLFQQRPSQGWGTRAQILDPEHSITAFYDALEQVDGYRELPVTEAAQRVQRSGFPDAYADHEPDARVLASALTGNSRAAFWCTVDDDRDEQAADLDDSGLTARAASVRADLARTFGELPLGGFAPGGVRDGHMAGIGALRGTCDRRLRAAGLPRQPAPRLGHRQLPCRPGRSARHQHRDLRRPGMAGGPALARGVARLPGPGVGQGRPEHSRAPRSRPRRRRSLTHPGARFPAFSNSSVERASSRLDQ